MNMRHNIRFALIAMITMGSVELKAQDIYTFLSIGRQISYPVGRFDISGQSPGSGTAEIGRGFAIEIGLELNSEWRVILNPYERRVYNAGSDFIYNLEEPGLPRFEKPEFAYGGNWTVRQSFFAVDHFFKFFKDKLNIGTGLCMGELKMRSPYVQIKTDSEGTFYHKDLTLASSDSRSFLMGIRGNISYMFVDRLSIYAALQCNTAQAKFRNVQLHYFTDRVNAPEQGFERRIDFRQHYTALNVMIGLNYIDYF